MHSLNIKLVLFLAFVGIETGCAKFVTIDPPSTQLIGSTVFTSDATANAAIVGVYSNMMSAQFGFYGGGLSLQGGLSADEFLNYSSSTAQSEFATNNIKPDNNNIKLYWGQAYKAIYAANAVLEGLRTAANISPENISELTGEAKFIRAFSYFYLVNLWGDVPLVLQTTYTLNDTMRRTATYEVYQQIIRDLKDAQELLPADFSAGGGERIRPNLWAATALLARVYLYTHQWQDAVDHSTSVITSTGFFSLESDLNKVFLTNSTEAIWQLLPVTPQVNTWEGYFFIMTNGISSSRAKVAFSQELLSAFESGDQRRLNWINIDSFGGTYNYYPFKYKIRSGNSLGEYEIVLRLAEQYLIRAEAQANLGNTSASIADLNIIRERAGLPDLLLTLTTEECLIAVAHERQTELFAEWDHRWLDLKRTGQATTVLTPLKPDWRATDEWYPIPQTEIQNDPNLVQNSGY